MNDRTTAPRAPAKGGALVALVGAAVAMLLVPLTTNWEGKRNAAYLDPVKVLTICYGDTANVRAGEVDSDAQCLARLDTQLAAHAKPVLACTPGLAGHPAATAAAIDLAYNIGGPTYCRSSVARLFNLTAAANDNERPRIWRQACDAILAFRFAKGRELPGLVNRRRAERDLCMKDAA